jgi:hypothetical protein
VRPGLDRLSPFSDGRWLPTAVVCLAVLAVASTGRGQEPGTVAAAIEPLPQQPVPPELVSEPPDEPAFRPPVIEPASASPPASDDIVLELLPFGVLWEPPIANQREPRCSVNFSSLHGAGMIDTAIGADFALTRIGPASHKDEGLEVDVFAAVFTRFGARRELSCADYRVGCPLTFAKNDWQFKLSYEHTSTHTGDDGVMDLIDQGLYTGSVFPARKFCRDEIVLGVAHRFGERVRVYGQMGGSFTKNVGVVNDTWRYDWGVEWTPPRWSPVQSGPYAAFDMDLRDEQHHVPNVTVQAGWQWRVGRGRSSAARLGVEYYDGKSPFGCYIQEHESWWSFIASYDW